MLLSTDPSPRALPRVPLPAGVEVSRETIHGGSGEIRADDHLICAPHTVAEVVTLVNWAHRNGWRLRATGIRPGCSPPTLTPTPPRTLLLDLSRHMNRARIDSGTPASVTALTGITMESLLAQLEQAGYGVAACPGAGDMTLGDALSMGAHGTAIPATDEARVPGHTYGLLNNLIVSLTAVVWDATQHAYVARTVQRSDPRIGALLVHFGRALIVAAKLRVGPLQHLRCVSRTDLSAATVFAPPTLAGPQSFAALLEECGRIESRWLPFTPAPWLKTWSVAPERPATSREADTPYNYPFADDVGTEQSALFNELAEGNTWVTPLLTGLAYAGVVAGLPATTSVDLWGPAKNTQLYARPTTQRLASTGYAVLTTRDRVQHVVSAFYDYLSATLERYRAEDRFPVNGPWEVRVTGLDDPADCGVSGAQPAQLSAARSHADRAFDVAVWLTVCTLPGTPDSQRFYAELDAWIKAAFTSPHEAVRPEWPTSDDNESWAAALTTLNRLDPHGIYFSAQLD